MHYSAFVLQFFMCSTIVKMDEKAMSWMESADDNLCIEALKGFESSIGWQLLNDGNDNLFENVYTPPEVEPPEVEILFKEELKIPIGIHFLHAAI